MFSPQVLWYQASWFPLTFASPSRMEPQAQTKFCLFCQWLLFTVNCLFFWKSQVQLEIIGYWSNFSPFIPGSFSTASERQWRPYKHKFPPLFCQGCFEGDGHLNLLPVPPIPGVPWCHKMQGEGDQGWPVFMSLTPIFFRTLKVLMTFSDGNWLHSFPHEKRCYHQL